MRIRFDHQIFGLQEYGGISRYAYELASQLSKNQENDVGVISPLYVNQYLSKAPELLQVVGKQIPYISKTGRIVNAVNDIIAWPFWYNSEPDIVHETYYAAKSVAPKRSKIILTVYDMIHEKFPSSFGSFSDNVGVKKSIALARADHILCISKNTQKDLVELLGVNIEKTSVTYLGFTPMIASNPGNDVNDKKPYILYVGNRSGYKNFSNMLQAVASSVFLKKGLDIVCFGGGGFSNNEKEQIKNLGFADGQVRQLSGSDDILAGLYKNARAFVYPSLYEGFGIPPLEAMSFGCPVVCSAASSIPEVVGEAGIYFDPHDIGDMSKNIEKVVSDEALRTCLVAAGSERVKDFSWEHCASETLEIYRKVIG